MQIKITSSSAINPSAITTYHGDQEIEWEGTTFNKKELHDPANLFTNINLYLASLPQEQQQTIWENMVRIKETLNEVNESTMLHRIIRDSVKKIYEIINFDDVRRHVMIHGKILVHSDIKGRFEEVENPTPDARQTTYLKEGYTDLSVLSVMLKLMAPVFGEYIRRMTHEISNMFKEHYAFYLLTSSSIMNNPTFEGLRNYVEAVIDNEQRKSSPSEFRRNSAILGGLGTEELPDWVLGRVVVRKISINEEMGGENMVATIYKYIISQLQQLDKTFKARINNKNPPYTNQSDEDNISVAENYKIKQVIPDGILRVLSIYTEEMYDMAGRVDPTFDPEKVRICYALASQNDELQICDHHFTITQWVLSRAISPRAIPSLNKPALMKSLAVTQALLWHWQLYELALLMMAEPSKQISESAGQSTSQLKKSYVEILTPMFPHYQRVSKTQHSDRNVNVACKAIEKVQGQLVQNDWNVTGPIELCQEGKLAHPGRVHMISAEIKQYLAELIIKVQKLKNDTPPQAI